MKSLSIAVVAAGLVGGCLFAQTTPASAQEIGVGIGVPGFAFSFDTGAVAYAYHDGYWDHDHHWHGWRNARERDAYRAQYHDRYDDHYHNRVAHAGWHDEERHDEERR